MFQCIGPLLQALATMQWSEAPWRRRRSVWATISEDAWQRKIVAHTVRRRRSCKQRVKRGSGVRSESSAPIIEHWGSAPISGAMTAHQFRAEVERTNHRHRCRAPILRLRASAPFIGNRGRATSRAGSDNGTHQRAGTVDVPFVKARKPGSVACDGYPPFTAFS